jgi:hypothetical protein
MNRKKVWILLTVVLLLVATGVLGGTGGEIDNQDDTRGGGESDGKAEGASGHRHGGLLEHDQPGDVYYHEGGDQKSADRVQVLSAMGSAGAANGSKAARTKP